MNHISTLKVVEVGEALLDRLRLVYPNKLPTEHTTEVELAILQGQQSVIAYLTALSEDIHEANMGSLQQE
jgi:hypothetical protein